MKPDKPAAPAAIQKPYIRKSRPAASRKSRKGGHKKPRGEKRPRGQGNPVRGIGIVAAPAPPVIRNPGASDYSDEKATLICARLAEGTSLNRICCDPDMPAIGTVYNWMRARKEFAEAYDRARLDQADTLADQAVLIADTPNEGIKTKSGPNGLEITTGDNVERSRLQVDTRKWAAAVLKPAKYKPVTGIEATGANGEPLIPPVIGISFAQGGPGNGDGGGQPGHDPEDGESGPSS